MDPIWKNLPVDLVEKICNFLPQVRWVNPDLKNELVNTYKRQVYNKIVSTYVGDYGGMYYNLGVSLQRARELFAADMYDILNDYNETPQTQWLFENFNNPWALFKAMSEEQIEELMIGI